MMSSWSENRFCGIKIASNGHRFDKHNGILPAELAA
jgi:hypothetical protein